VRWLLRDRYPSLERAPSVSCPTLVIAGDRDSIIPAEQSRRLYAALAAEKRLVVIAGADHNDEALFDGQQLIQAVLDFVASLERR
jgi:pimeloyl-ACP methyl ester carboxylesterase